VPSLRSGREPGSQDGHALRAAAYRRIGETVYVNLWVESEKRARNTIIDILEIRESYNLNYDLAIETVVKELTKDRRIVKGVLEITEKMKIRRSTYLRKVPVIIKGNPPLSETAKRLLSVEFWGVRVEK